MEKTITRRFAVALVIGLLINLCGAFMGKALGIGMFFDTVGTVFTAVFSGYFPAMGVGILTSLLEGIREKEAFYGMLFQLLTALAAGVWAGKGFLKKPVGYLLLVPVLYLAGGGHGFFMDAVLTELSGEALPAMAQIAREQKWELIEIGVTVVLLWLARTFLPERLQEALRITGWHQRPLTAEELKEAAGFKNRGTSLRTRVLLMVFSLNLVVSLAAMTISALLYRRYTIDEHVKLAKGITGLVASMIDPEKVEWYMERNDNVAEYRDIKSRMYHVRESSPDILYIYVYQIKEDGCHVVFDLDTDELPGAEPGTVQPFDESFSEFIPDLLAGRPIDPIISNDTYGNLLTVYLPLYDREGVCRCYVAADVAMYLINNNMLAFVGKLFALFLSFLIMSLAVGTWVSEYRITMPIRAMDLKTRRFSYDSIEALEKNYMRIRDLSINTGDEIEALYQTILHSAEKNEHYARDLKEQTENVARMQNALILVLADMVESRDESTGAHVRKTAAYTRIIMDKMKELGYYKDQLTDKFVSDVENSAPLHDIGKIQVSDVILNKPGRLTDEEFEIMKTHTTAGSHIITQAMAAVPSSAYLEEAKNLAEFHHEKWNGKGYPHGLSGEAIPLSARIMAVADVFDALVSERVYKKAFSFEKAMDIIKEEAGTHFDPLVADAFLQAQEKVREVSEYFSRLTDPSPEHPGVCEHLQSGEAKKD